jgi:hypothetical protein
MSPLIVILLIVLLIVLLGGGGYYGHMYYRRRYHPFDAPIYPVRPPGDAGPIPPGAAHNPDASQSGLAAYGPGYGGDDRPLPDPASVTPERRGFFPFPETRTPPIFVLLLAVLLIILIFCIIAGLFYIAP